jgi:hypothetical protein
MKSLYKFKIIKIKDRLIECFTRILSLYSFGFRNF